MKTNTDWFKIQEKMLNENIKHEKEIRKSIDLMLGFGTKISSISFLKKSKNRDKWQIKHDKEMMSLYHKVIKITDLQLDILNFVSRRCVKGKIDRFR
jgi:hypothetical protein